MHNKNANKIFIITVHKEWILIDTADISERNYSNIGEYTRMWHFTLIN